MPEQRKPFVPPTVNLKSPPIRDGRLPDDPKIDWKGYFLRFCQAHGEPELLGGNLIFRDGWSYSGTDYKGPENPPSPDPIELDETVVRYWKGRRARCDQMLSKAIAVRERIETEQRKRSLPLQQTVFVQEEGTTKKGAVSLNTSALDLKIKWLRADIEEADRALVEMISYYKNKVI